MPSRVVGRLAIVAVAVASIGVAGILFRNSVDPAELATPMPSPLVVDGKVYPYCTPAPLRPDRAAQLTADGAVVVFERSGGYACRRDIYAVFPDGRILADPAGSVAKTAVAPSRVSDLLDTIADEGFFTDEVVTTYHEPCRACYQYSITVTSGDRTKTVGAVDGGTEAPVAFWRVVGRIAGVVGPTSGS